MKSRPLTSTRRLLGPILALPTPVIFVAAAALATYFLWRQGSLNTIGVSIATVPPWKVVGVLAAYAASIVVLSVRWHTLTRLAGGAPAVIASSEVFLTSVIVNYAAPIGLAVPTRAALTVRDLGLSPVQSATVVGWELGLDIVALLAISVAWLVMDGPALLQSMPLDLGRLQVVVVVIAVALLLLGAALRVTTVKTRLALILGPMYREPMRRPLVALTAVALTGLFWTAQLGIMSTLLGMFGTAVVPSLVFGLMGLPMLIGMLSPIPGGAGVREALMAATASLEGVASAPVVLAAVAYRLALFVVTPLVWGALRVARRWSNR